jgi:hypothetical protein
LLFLAEPTVVLQVTRQPRPLLWMLFDGTDSMAIVDDLSDSQRRRLADATGLSPTESSNSSTAQPARIDYLRALVARREANLLSRLEEKYRLKCFLFERPDAVRTLSAARDGEPDELDPKALAEELTTRGPVTALGGALADLARRHSSQHLAGVVVFSDFDQNSGPAPLAAARQLNVPIYAVGVGPEVAVDLAVDLEAPLLMKKGEASTLTVTVRQTDLDGRMVPVRVTARPVSGDTTVRQPVGEQQVQLTGPSTTIRFPFTPTETGRFVFIAESDPQEGEVLRQNNVAQREVNIQDDFLRLMYVEYEPTWEWRFIKEVFHRDRLVGERGFRTFLRSADPKVRKSNDLFLTTLTPPRSEFFAYDVIFLGDMPAPTLSKRFTENVQEFVSEFGGGLVVLSGPNFGPAQLAGTPLADMLPVVVDTEARLRDAREFAPRLTPEAARYDFMQLAAGTTENQRAWANLGRLPWYQPVARVRDGATVLLAHPSDRCTDGKTPQPIIATRRYGKGQVVYLATNETWRLRRLYGEAFYRRFWGQMIYRLGLSHALGDQKRFVVRTDRQQYQVDDRVLLTVDAYDQNFEPLVESKLPQRKLTGRLLPPAGTSTAIDADSDSAQPISIAQVRPGVFEASLPVLSAGEHRIEVVDPISNQTTAVTFQAISQSLERRSAVRNTALEEQLAAATGGKTYDLTTVARLPDEIHAHTRVETSIEVVPLWNTWLAFSLVVALLLIEWTVRKWVNLP